MTRRRNKKDVQLTREQLRETIDLWRTFLRVTKRQWTRGDLCTVAERLKIPILALALLDPASVLGFVDVTAFQRWTSRADFEAVVEDINEERRDLRSAAWTNEMKARDLLPRSGEG